MTAVRLSHSIANVHSRQQWRWWRKSLLLFILFACCCLVMMRTMILSQVTTDDTLYSNHSMNVFVKKETTQTVVVDSFRVVCSQLEEQSTNDNTLRHFQMDSKTCHPGSMGNSLAQMYMTELVSKLAGAGFDVGCNQLNVTTESVQYMLPIHRSPFRIYDISWRDVCSSCPSYFPHTCPTGLEHMTPAIRDDLRIVARTWLELNPKAELDDAVIHLRCGDILIANVAHLFGGKYGFSPYNIYNFISPAVKRIGILTGSFDNITCRPADCPFVDTCKHIVLDLQLYLQQHWNATVAVRSQETPVASYARMVLSKQLVCDSSTFCIFPAIASMGTAFVTQSDELYPWVNAVGKKEENVHLIPRDDTFLTVGEIAKKKLSLAEIVALLRRGAALASQRNDRH